jgi:small-conductance mechanosensitive channel
MDKNRKSWVRWTRWIARIWSLGPILFVLGEILFPHGDESVEVPWTAWVNLSLIFIAVLGLALAWRWERLGGWLALGFLAAFLALFFINVERSFSSGLIFLVAVGVPAVLFLISSYAESSTEKKEPGF